MKKSAFFLSLLPLLPLLLLEACVEKNVHQAEQPLPVPAAQSKVPFFMSKPQPTTPVEVVFDDQFDKHKTVNYRKSDALRMSASATFIPNAVKELAKPAKKSKAQFYVFDLRQESHGYINDKPVTWASEHEWSNVDMNHDEAIQRERRLLMDTSMGSKIAGKVVQSTETEESVVRSRGFEYVRLTVTEHLRPSDNEVDRFLVAVHAMPEKSWVHFHDRDGKGRSTMFMVMYDMLRNAKSEAIETIIKRNSDLSGGEDVLGLPAQDAWNYVYQKERADFIREFYNFAKANPNGDGQLWTEWVMKK